MLRACTESDSATRRGGRGRGRLDCGMEANPAGMEKKREQETKMETKL